MSRRKGMRYENDVANYIGDRYIKTNRGGFDGDDGHLGELVSVECKNQKTLDLAGWLKQARDNAGERIGVVIHKRRGVSNVGDHYVLLSVDDFLELWQRAELDGGG